MKLHLYKQHLSTNFNLFSFLLPLLSAWRWQLGRVGKLGCAELGLHKLSNSSRPYNDTSKAHPPAEGTIALAREGEEKKRGL